MQAVNRELGTGEGRGQRSDEYGGLEVRRFENKAPSLHISRDQIPNVPRISQIMYDLNTGTLGVCAPVE